MGEAISRKSKRRVHYQKFVKGKDSSNYSADDLGCILGTNSEKVGAKAKAIVQEATTEEEENNGKFTQAAGSYQDYFAAKMAALKAKGKYSDVPDWTEEKTNPQTVGLGAAGGRAVDREVERDSLLYPDYLREANERNAMKKVQQEDSAPDIDTAGDENVDACTVAKDENLLKEENEAEQFVKKKKSKDKNITNEEGHIEASVDDITEEITKKKKKSKKHKNKDTLEDVEVLEDSSMEKQKKKKHKKNKHEDIVEENTDSVQEALNDSFEEKLKKKKTKKSKKEKVDDKEKEAAVEDSGCEDMEIKAKKVKKSKKEKSKESSTSLADKVVHNQAEQSSKRKADNDESETHDEPPPKKKSKKKAKVTKEEVVDPEDDVPVLSKDYKEAPGGFKGSNLMAIPGYGNVK